MPQSSWDHCMSVLVANFLLLVHLATSPLLLACTATGMVTVHGNYDMSFQRHISLAGYIDILIPWCYL